MPNSGPDNVETLFGPAPAKVRAAAAPSWHQSLMDFIGERFEAREPKSYDSVEFAASKDETRSTLASAALNDLQQALIDRERQELGVDYNRQLLEQWGVVVPGSEQTG